MVTTTEPDIISRLHQAASHSEQRASVLRSMAADLSQRIAAAETLLGEGVEPAVAPRKKPGPKPGRKKGRKGGPGGLQDAGEVEAAPDTAPERDGAPEAQGGRFCVHCGDELGSRRRDARFCSQSCWSKWSWRRRPPEERQRLSFEQCNVAEKARRLAVREKRHGQLMSRLEREHPGLAQRVAAGELGLYAAASLAGWSSSARKDEPSEVRRELGRPPSPAERVPSFSAWPEPIREVQAQLQRVALQLDLVTAGEDAVSLRRRERGLTERLEHLKSQALSGVALPVAAE
jgi:hypothetical protein